MKQVQIGWEQGLVIAVNNKVLVFDSKKNDTARSARFISHAHYDHLCNFRNCSNIAATRQTIEIVSSTKNLKENLFSQYDIGQTVRFDDVEVTIHDAGHILGSAQFSIYTSTKTIVYTGDINCRDMFTTKAAEEVECDVLILETTYGHPFYIFPNLSQISLEMVNWTVKEIRRGKTPVFKVYSCGKPQEIIRMFNIFTNILVVTDQKITATTNIYTKNHIPLSFLGSHTMDGKEALASGEAVFITSKEVPPIVRKPVIASATGWALSGWRKEEPIAFPLSCHADF
ncbi:MAG: MBL fold metallo-hydrolase, partial [Candidatus Bathyarchaeia archaeon]